MRVLVTGGSGFIGSYVVDRLRELDYEPWVFDRSGASPGFVHLGDIRDRTAVNEAMAHSDAWIHLAGVLGTQETVLNPLPAVETNVLGGVNVLEAAAEYGLPGVCIAVGNHWEQNTYSITKTTIERFCHMYRDYRGLPVTVVRALNAYGPRQSVADPYGPSKVRKIMPSFICRALVGAPIEIYGDGQQIMDMVYVTDVARYLVDALEYTLKNGAAKGVVEVGTGRRTSVNFIAAQVVKAAGASSDLLSWGPMRVGEQSNAVVVADTDTLAYIGAEPSFIPAEDGIRRTVDWFREEWLPRYA